MTRIKKLFLFLIIDVVIIAVVISLFLNIDRKVAGLIGGSLFLLQGLYILTSVYKWPYRQRYFTFYGSIAHIFLATLPLIFLRLSFWSTPFDLIEFGFITGPGFHNFSEKLYVVLIGCHVLDIIKELFLIKKIPR